MTIPENFVPSPFKAALAGWLTLVAVMAAFFFLVPHGPGFAPEMGPFATFLVFTGLYSAYYVADFLIIACVTMFVLRQDRRLLRHWWLWSVFGAMMFAISVPIWSWFLDVHGFEKYFLTALGFLVGFASFAASLSPLKPLTR